MSQSPPPKPTPPPRDSTGKVLVIVFVCVGLFFSLCLCGPIGIALLLPAVQAARDAARTNGSKNNLKQIGLALHQYHSQHESFPPAYTVDESGRPLHSWRTLILPQLEQQNLYDQINLDEPWDSPANAPLTDEVLKVFQSPHDGGRNVPMTNYVVITSDPEDRNNWSRSIFLEHVSKRIADIRDGTTSTIMVVEIVNSDIHWAEPRDIDVDNIRRVEEGADPGVPNVIPRRAVLGFADGSVRISNEQIDAQMFRELISPSGGEVVAFPGD